MQVTSLVEVWIEILMVRFQNALRWSLPLWKCGLKCTHDEPDSCGAWSLPLWKCGLKYKRRKRRVFVYLSLPLWKCGLKL